MVEILFTIFIMAIALFGLSALQLTAIQSVSNSQIKTNAIFYLDDMAERIRSNTAGQNNGEYLQITGNEVNGGSIANSDAYLWNQLIKNNMPEGAIGTVEYDSNTQLYVIEIAWNEKQNEHVSDSLKPKSLTLSVR